MASERSAALPDNKRMLGITVLGDFLVSEGVQAVLENLLRVGATAVAINPTVTAAGNETNGSWQPPRDAGHSPRTFDRPLFGQSALWLRSGPSYRPNSSFYRDSPYPPRKTNDLTDAHGPLVGQFIESAAASGLEVYLQLGAAQPSGLRDEDRPRLPDGSLPRGRIADVGSLASPAVRAYNEAYVRDLLEQYPDIAGFRIDWPEYPCYSFDEIFQDFSSHVALTAEQRGLELPQLARDVQRFRVRVREQLTNDLLRRWADPHHGDQALAEWLADFPAVASWLQLKQALSGDLVGHWQAIVKRHGGGRYKLSLHGFSPPWSQLTGFNYATAADHCDSMSPKLYTMHWCLMIHLWGHALLQHNAGLDERLLVNVLERLLGLVTEPTGKSLADYQYPAPDQPHPIGDAAQRLKIEQVLRDVGNRVEVYPLIHPYGPAADFRRRLQIGMASPTDGVWINRYGYLSDEKLAIVADCVARH